MARSFERWLESGLVGVSAESVEDIRNNRSIRRKVVQIRNTPQDEFSKQVDWIEYVEQLYGAGSITDWDRRSLLDWEIDW